MGAGLEKMLRPHGGTNDFTIEVTNTVIDDITIS